MESPNKRLSRRDFLKYSALGAGVIGTAGIYSKAADAGVLNIKDRLTGENISQFDYEGLDFPLGKAISSTLLNNATANAFKGYVYKYSTTRNGSFINATQGENALAIVALENITSKSKGKVHMGSGIVDVYVDRNASRGDFLYFSNITGQARPSKERMGGAFGQVVEPRTGAGLIKSYIFPREVQREWNAFDAHQFEFDYVRPLFGVVDDPQWVRSATNPIIVDAASKEPNAPQHPLYKNGILFLPYNRGGGGNQCILGWCSIPNDDFDSVIYDSANWNETILESGNTVQSPGIIFDRTDNLYKVWYERSGTNTIYYKTCPETSNPTNTSDWSAGVAQTSPTDFAGGPSVIKLGGMYYLFYYDTNLNTLTAYSDDGGVTDTWNNGTTVLTTGGVGEFDENYALLATPFAVGGNVYVMYLGRDDPGTNIKKLGLALQSEVDFLLQQSMTKFTINPVFQSTGTGWENGDSLRGGTFFVFGRKIYLFYAAQNDSDRSSIGIATLDIS